MLRGTEPSEPGQAGESPESVDPGPGDYNLAAIPGLVEPGDSVSEGVVAAVEGFCAEMGVEPAALRSAASELHAAYQNGVITDEQSFVAVAPQIGERLGAERWEVEELVSLVRETVGLEGERARLVADRDFGRALHNSGDPKHMEARQRWNRAWGR